MGGGLHGAESWRAKKRKWVESLSAVHAEVPTTGTEHGRPLKVLLRPVKKEQRGLTLCLSK